jgi:hypothetical protein
MSIKQQYHRLSSDSESTDSTMIDFNNSGFDADNVPLLDTNSNDNYHNNQQNRNVSSTLYSNTNRQILPLSSSYKNSVVKRLYWSIFIACLFAIPGLVLNCVSYVETATSADRVFNIGNEYLYSYFFVLMLFYAIYIGITLIILMITFCENLSIDNVGFPLLITNILFKVNIILRMLVIGIVVIRIIDNTPFMVIPITNASYTDSKGIVDVYLPRCIEYLIIENIIYTYLAYINGINTSIIQILINL